MRKTDLRSRSFNIGSNGEPLLNVALNYHSTNDTMNEDESCDEYNTSVRQTSAGSTDFSSSSVHLKKRHHHRLSPTDTIHESASGPSSEQLRRRHSQQPLSSPRLPLLAPEFVITSASKIIAADTNPARRSPSYSRDDTRTPDFSIYSYEDEDDDDDEDVERGYVPSQNDITRRRTVQLENDHRPPTNAVKEENERRWSSDSTHRRRTANNFEPTNESSYHQPDEDPYYQRYREENSISSRRRNTIVPPPAIVTTATPVSPIRTVSPYRRRLSAGATNVVEYRDEIINYSSEHKNFNLLNVPGYESSTTVTPSPSTPTITRSRSQSTPSSPELIRLQQQTSAVVQSNHQKQNRDRDRDKYAVVVEENYSKEKRRSLSPERFRSENFDEDEDDMQSPYHRHRLDRRNKFYSRDEEDADDSSNEGGGGSGRKHSYTEIPCGRGGRQAEIRRIASGSICIPPTIDTHRRRVLPPTPDQLLDKQQHQQRAQVNSTPPQRRYDRSTVRETSGSGYNTTTTPSSLPSQQAPTPFYCAAGLDDDDRREEMVSKSRNGSRELASVEQRASLIDEADCALKNEQLSQNQRVYQFDEQDEEEAVRCSIRRARRATAIGDCAMIPAAAASSSSPTNSRDSPRSGRGRKLPETPTLPSNPTPPPNMKMTSIARQNTMGDLLRQQPASPPTSTRFHTPSRRVSEQIFTKTSVTKKGFMARIAQDIKSPPSDLDEHTTLGASAAAATSSKSPEPVPPPSRSNIGLLSQFRQSSVSSSSSVPDLITTPTTNISIVSGVGPGIDAATDSGHGSGAESGVGDGATVSGSNSWPDAIGIGGLNLGQTNSASTTASIGADGLLTPGSSSGLGVLHFTIQYFPVRKRLRISVIKAERLAGQLRLDLELNTFVKLCLMPGKIQKQRGSRIVKRTRDATFNEEFFFDNITPDDVETKFVHLRLCHHVGKQFQKDVVIGQLEISLKDILNQLLSKQEIKLCQELKPKQLKKLGRLTISTCLENDARRLTINILKVDDLPKFGISGPPDPCVRISVDQNGKVQTKQSRILKSTCNAVFREAVMFLVSTKREDLERTKIIVTVHDMARATAGDDIIGNVYLGQFACDKTELDQWRNTLTHSGREFKATHQLKREPNSGGDDDMINSLSGTSNLLNILDRWDCDQFLESPNLYRT